jgi:hypothetical protein
MRYLETFECVLASMDYYRLGYPAGWQVTRTPPNGAMLRPPTAFNHPGTAMT